MPRAEVLFTSPWKGEVGSRSEPGGVAKSNDSSRIAFGDPTLPFQGRVKKDALERRSGP
jgi:hypothetical protein